MRRCLVLTLAFASAPSFAQDVRGAYVGFGIDQIDYSDTIYRIDFDETAMNQKLVAGFRFKDTLAVEVSYGTSEEFATSESGFISPPFTSPVGPIGGTTSVRIAGSFDVFELRALTHQGHAVLGIGFFSADSEVSANGASDLGPIAGSRGNSDSGFSIILGAQWDLEDWGIRAEYSYFDLEGDADAFSIGAGFHYRF